VADLFFLKSLSLLHFVALLFLDLFLHSAAVAGQR